LALNTIVVEHIYCTDILEQSYCVKNKILFSINLDYGSVRSTINLVAVLVAYEEEEKSSLC